MVYRRIKRIVLQILQVFVINFSNPQKMANTYALNTIDGKSIVDLLGTNC